MTGACLAIAAAPQSPKPKCRRHLGMELDTLYQNRHKLGIFFGAYWSSSESNDGRAWYQNFLFFGYQDYDDMRYGRVRAVRTF
jgi:hypothetical protein